MLDKVIKISNKQAYLIYDDGRVVSLWSDTDVNEIINIMLRPLNYSGDFETHCRSMDDTASINILKKVI